MLVDIHIHTSRYSECSSLHPIDMAVAAKEAGLDGICLTEHQTVWSPGRSAGNRQGVRHRSVQRR